jgi:Cu/Ag efflux protein CusF
MNKATSLIAALALAAFGAAQAAPNADAEVRKVDKATGRITLKHGEIKNLDMPPMTMVFGTRDKALLDHVKAGDKVRFSAESVNGQLIVTEIEPQK